MEVLLDFCHRPSWLVCKALPACPGPCSSPDACCPWRQHDSQKLPGRPLPLQSTPCSSPDVHCSCRPAPAPAASRMPAAPGSSLTPRSSTGRPLPLRSTPCSSLDARCPHLPVLVLTVLFYSKAPSAFISKSRCGMNVMRVSASVSLCCANAPRGFCGGSRVPGEP